MPKNHVSALIDYIMTHERADFLDQCAEHDLSEIEGLFGSDRSEFHNGLDGHIYYHAAKAADWLERVNQLTVDLRGEVDDA